MKIAAIDSFHVRGTPAQTYWGARTWGSNGGLELDSYPPAARRRYIYSATIDAVLVRVRTTDGLEGWGEAKAPVGGRATKAIIDELLAPIAMDSSLDEISRTWDRMYAGMRVRGHDSGFWLEAIAGVDIALWDAWARALSRPLCTLLGGRYRTRLPIYASGIPAAGPGSGDGGQARVRAEAERLVADGYEAVKVAIGASPFSDVASVRTVREVFGDAASVFADAAGQYDYYDALQVGRRLSDIGVGFYEMPLPPEDLDGYTRLARQLDIPIALDSLATRHRALEFLRAGALHVLQPDVCRAGGITETMRIAALADAFGARATPHVSIGSPVHVAASVHCAAAMPNFAVMEYWVGTNPLAILAPDALRPEGSSIDVPSNIGLGVTVDGDAVAALAGRGS
jgi:D-galactarolactone cycloisomerase